MAQAPSRATRSSRNAEDLLGVRAARLRAGWHATHFNVTTIMKWAVNFSRLPWHRGGIRNLFARRRFGRRGWFWRGRGAEPPSRRCMQDRQPALSKAGDHRRGLERAPDRWSQAGRHELPREPPARAACAPSNIGSRHDADLPAPPSPRICNVGSWYRHDRNAAVDWSGKYSHPATNRMCRKPDCRRQRRPEAGSQGGVAART